MNSLKLKIKNAFFAFEEKVLLVKEHVLTILTFRSRLFSLFESNQQIQEVEDESKTQLLENAETKQSCCNLYLSNYNGASCLCYQATKTCSSCTSMCKSVVDFAKYILGCFINLLCYPFIPCAIAFLPASFQFAGYSNINSLYPCYGKTCCFCIANQEKGCFKIFCSPVSYLIILSLLVAAGCFFLWNETQSSLIVIDLLLYFEDLNEAASVFFFVVSFTVVSFPIMWGYVFFNLAAGYLFGFKMGLAVVMFSVTIGLTVAHVVCKKYFSTCVMNLLRRRSNFDQIEAILQVIDGSSGLKVIALTRLTPIPFGFQNGLFAVSNVSLKYYLLASDVGLLPTQILNCYIASKFRSMDQILDQESPNGYLLFFMQVAIGVALMIFVIQRARKELANALQNSKTVQATLHEENFIAAKEALGLQDVKCTQPSSINHFTAESQRPILDV